VILETFTLSVLFALLSSEERRSRPPVEFRWVDPKTVHMWQGVDGDQVDWMMDQIRNSDTWPDILPPIWMWGRKEGHEYPRGWSNYLLDGHHRTTAALECGLDRIPAYVFDYDQLEAFLKERDWPISEDSEAAQILFEESGF
jgi:hypothetical protein